MVGALRQRAEKLEGYPFLLYAGEERSRAQSVVEVILYVLSYQECSLIIHLRNKKIKNLI